MINGSDLRDFYITQWRAIPDLVDAVGGDDSRIRSALGVAKTAKSLQREVLEMPDGSIWVAYQGFSRGNGRTGEITQHEIAAFIRAATADDDAHIQFGALMIDGIPDGQELPVRYLEFSGDTDMMNMPKFERVSTSELTFDIWKLSFTVSERI